MNARYSLGSYADAVAAAAARLDAAAVLPRLHARDYTLWSDGPTEIANRLDWLTSPADTLPDAPELRRFGQTVRAEGCRHVVLLGMGGSSLGPEVIRQVIGSAPGYPEMLTLDSTVPASVARATAAIDLAHSLFVVSSKSGGTVEPNAFYAHFRHLLTAALGPNAAGRHFVAVTDADTALHRLASQDGFRRCFLNNPNIGGRYSVLSHFGMTPAVLIGVDVARLLTPAVAFQEQAAASIGCAAENPAAWLGAIIGTLARMGRDKVTLAASNGAAGFGLWVEQLLAESLGKNGAGVIPVTGEPLLTPDCYGTDRLFVQIRLDSDDNSGDDAKLRRLQAAGHPVVSFTLSDAYDLGAEFYRWEYATVIAGHILGVNPFDQPDVQGAKDRTVTLLAQYAAAGQLPNAPTGNPTDLESLLAGSQPGDYLAIMAYLPDSPALETALLDLRQRVMRQYRIATTAGYGPRFLHSTGQLHKGGPNTGLFLQLTQPHGPDVPIPGWPYSFGILADAQAQSDLQALQHLGRRTASLRITGEPAATLNHLTQSI